MKREKQLAKNTIVVALGKISTHFVSFLLLPLYTAILTTKEYGIVDLLNTYVTLLMPLIFLQINQSIFRYLIDARKKEKEKVELISTCISTIIIQTLLFLFLYSILSIFIKNEYKYFLATNVVATMFSDTMLQISRGLGDNKTYSIGCIISGTGTIILNVLFIVVFSWGAYGMLIATLIANILCTIYVFLKKKIYKYYNINMSNKKTLRMLWKYSIPLVPNQLSWWIINASDRTIITYFLGIAINGIYSAANKFSAICTALFSIFNLTWTESASLHINDKDCDEYFTSILNMTLKIFISLCFMIIAIMPFVFKYIITSKDYSGAYYQIPILLIATIFHIIVSFVGSIYIALKKSSELAKTSIYSAIINIVTNLLLIKYIGVYAASISTLLAFLSMAIYRFICIQKFIRLKIKKEILITSTIIGLVLLYTYYIKNYYVSLIILLIVITFSIYNNYSLVGKSLIILRKKLNIFVYNKNMNENYNDESK